MRIYDKTRTPWKPLLLWSGLALLLTPAALPALEIDASLRARLSKAQAPVNLLVLLEDRMDFEALDRSLQGLTPQERRVRAIDALREHAARSQKALMPALEKATLARDALDVRHLWLANAVTLRGRGNVLEHLSRSAVAGVVLEDQGYEIVQATSPGRAVGEPPSRTETGTVWSLDYIGAPSVWEQGYDGSGIRIGHLDTGAWLEHPDLQDRLWTNPGEIPGNGIDDDDNGYVDDVHGYDFADHDNDPTDDGYFHVGGGHGTHTAGTVVGDGSGGLHTGVAPGGEIIVCKVMYTETGLGTFGSIAEGLQYSMEHGARLITMSVGAVGPLSALTMQATRQVGDALRAAGVLLFTSAGNAHEYLDPPFELTGWARVPSPWNPVFGTPYSSRSGVVAVGATAYESDDIWSGSSQGPADWANVLPWDDWNLAGGQGLTKPDIAAPGNGVSSLVRPQGYSQTNWSGTSMACPHAAGVAALMLHKNPALSVEDIDRILQETAVDVGDPGKDNAFGSGRIDAVAALASVPEAQLPSLVVSDAQILDANGNGSIEPGEAFDLLLTVTNNSVVVDASVVGVQTHVFDPVVTVVDGQAHLGSVPRQASGTHANDRLHMVAAATAQQGETFDVQVFLTAQGGYGTVVDLTFFVGLPELRTHRNDGLRLTVTDRGTLGFWDIQQLEGDGFARSGSSLLYVGGFWGGNSPEYVCNRDYVPTDDAEWMVTTSPNGRLALAEPEEANQHYVGIFDDGAHPQPKGIRVTQESLSWIDPYAQGFVILRYTIRNEGSETVTDYHAGVFCDWDFEYPFYTRAGTDSERRMAWMQDVYVTGEHVGVQLLSPSVASNVAIIHNPTFVHPNLQILDIHKWAFLNGTLGDADGTEDDEYSNLVAAGPFDIAPGEEVQVAFALVYGEDLADLQANADLAQARFGDVPSDASEHVPGRAQLQQNWPNPFNPQTRIAFDLPQAGRAVVTVLDVRGRVVRRLAQGTYAAGRHVLTWDGTDDQAQPQASGVYLVRLQADGRVQTRKMALLK